MELILACCTLTVLAVTAAGLLQLRSSLDKTLDKARRLESRELVFEVRRTRE